VYEHGKRSVFLSGLLKCEEVVVTLKSKEGEMGAEALINFQLILIYRRGGQNGFRT
jgi:hypothetical protein